MKKLLLVLIAFLTLTGIAHAQTIIQTGGDSGEGQINIFRDTNNNLWAVRNSGSKNLTIFNSTNNGTTWRVAYTHLSSDPLDIRNGRVKVSIDSLNNIYLVFPSLAPSSNTIYGRFNTSNGNMSFASGSNCRQSDTSKYSRVVPMRNLSVSVTSFDVGETKYCEGVFPNIPLAVDLNSFVTTGFSGQMLESSNGTLHVLVRNNDVTNISHLTIQNGVVGKITTIYGAIVGIVDATIDLQDNIYAVGQRNVPSQTTYIGEIRRFNITTGGWEFLPNFSYVDYNISNPLIRYDVGTGRLWMFFHNSFDGITSSSTCAMAFSNNGGESWSPRQELNATECARITPKIEQTWISSNQINTTKENFFDLLYMNGSADAHMSYVRITADANPPTVNIVSPTGNLSSAIVSLNFNAADDLGVITCKYELDGNPNVSLPACANTSFGVAQGAHTIKVFADDQAGNQGSDTETFFVDSVAPTVSIISPTGSFQFDVDNVTYFVALNYNAADAGSGLAPPCLLELDGTPNVTLTGCNNGTIGTTRGSHSYKIFAFDNAGNRATASAAFTINQAPQLQGTNALVVNLFPVMLAVLLGLFGLGMMVRGQRTGDSKMFMNGMLIIFAGLILFTVTSQLVNEAVLPR